MLFLRIAQWLALPPLTVRRPLFESQPFCVTFACSPCACVGFPKALQLPPIYSKDMLHWLICWSLLTVPSDSRTSDPKTTAERCSGAATVGHMTHLIWKKVFLSCSVLWIVDFDTPQKPAPLSVKTFFYDEFEIFLNWCLNIRNLLLFHPIS